MQRLRKSKITFGMAQINNIRDMVRVIQVVTNNNMILLIELNCMAMKKDLDKL